MQLPKKKALRQSFALWRTQRRLESESSPFCLTLKCFLNVLWHSSRTAADVTSGLVAKCLGAPKARTKDLAIQIALMYVEIEKYEVVQEEILKGIAASKNPKVVSACIATLTQALR